MVFLKRVGYGSGHGMHCFCNQCWVTMTHTWRIWEEPSLLIIGCGEKCWWKCGCDIRLNCIGIVASSDAGIQVHSHTHTHAHIHTWHIHMAYTRTCHIHTWHIHTWQHIHTHGSIYMHMAYTCTCAYTHTHAHIHTYTHTHKHAHTCIYTHPFLLQLAAFSCIARKWDFITTQAKTKQINGKKPLYTVIH